jgi:hypothetical protein
MFHFSSFINLFLINQLVDYINFELKKIKARISHERGAQMYHIGPIGIRPAQDAIFGLLHLCRHPGRIL